MVHMLGGADISWTVGAVVAGAAYGLTVCRVAAKESGAASAAVLRP